MSAVRRQLPTASCRRPVGFFDSGVGGLCILEAFKRTCPNESTVYIADSANCPYGNRPAREILRLSMANARTLIGKYGCKMVVVACNTATAAAIDALRAKWPDVPFVGLEPALKPAALKSKTGVVGVLATAGTFNGRLYNETKAKFARGVTVIATVADEWVEEVERLWVEGCGFQLATHNPQLTARLEKVVRQRVEPLLAAGADKLVLGCTHFPHLKGVIEKVAAGRAEVIDPSDAVARQTKRVLADAAKGEGVRSVEPVAPTHVFIRTTDKGE